MHHVANPHLHKVLVVEIETATGQKILAHIFTTHEDHIIRIASHSLDVFYCLVGTKLWDLRKQHHTVFECVECAWVMAFL